MLIQDLFPQFRRYALHQRGFRPKTYHSIRYTLLRMERESSVTDISQLTRPTIIDFLSMLQEKKDWQASTYRNHLQNIKTFCEWLVDERMMKLNPAEGIKKPKLPQRVPRYIPKDGVAKLEQAIFKIDWPNRYILLRNRAMFNTFLLSGIRLSELRNLRVDDFNSEEQTLLIRQGKNSKDRLLPVHPRLLFVLDSYLKQRNELENFSPFLFASQFSENPLNHKSIHVIFRRISEKAKVKCVPHALRHTFARECINKGMGLYQVKNLLGHSDINSTLIYLSIARNDLQNSFKHLDLFTS